MLKVQTLPPVQTLVVPSYTFKVVMGLSNVATAVQDVIVDGMGKLKTASRPVP